MSEPSPPADDPTWVDNVLARARARAQAQAQSQPTPSSAPSDPFVVREPRARPESAGAPRDERASRPVPAAAQANRADTAGTAARSGLSAGPAVAARSERRVTPTPITTDVDSPDRPSVYDEPADEDSEQDPEETAGGLRNAAEWIAVAVGAVLVAFLIRAFLLQAFYIPSESMLPTLRKDDRILVNKVSYRLHDVNRGDLVVFERPPSMPPGDNVKDLIKRVIALPGETIELRGSDIYIDDRKLTEPYLPEGTVTVNLRWVTGCDNPPSDSAKCTIPAGHVFVMGDNRSHSTDGRVFGPISQDLIVGRAFLRVWPLGDFKSL